MSSIWEILSGLRGIDEAEMPWFGKILAMLVASQSQLSPYMRAAYGQEPRMATRSPFANINEMQDVMGRAQREETVAPAQFNPYILQNLLDWVQPQETGLPKAYAGLDPELQKMIGGWAQAPGQIRKTEIMGRQYGDVPLGLLMRGITRPQEALRLFAPYGKEKRGYEMGKLGAEEEGRKRAAAGYEGLQEVLNTLGIDTDISTLQAVKGIGGIKAIEKLAPGLFPEEEPKEPEAPWVLKEQTKDLLYREPKAKEKKIEGYRQKFETAWVKRYPAGWKRPKKGLDGREIPESIPDSVLEKYARRAFWETWRGNVLPEHRAEVGRELGVIEPVTTKPKTPQNIYNACRDAGGTHEECLTEAGVTLNK